MTKDVPAVDRYLEIAERQFADNGFHGGSLAALAAEADVTKQALLHFFGSKERLYGEVLKRLSARLSAQVDASEGSDPASSLIAYFDALAQRSTEQPAEASLVVRALLDTDAEARFWPMKSFLDHLTELALETPRWQSAQIEDVQAGLFQMIGALQYLSVSGTALEGMYGQAGRRAIEDRFREHIGSAIREFVGSG